MTTGGKFILGLDLGSTAVKAAIVDASAPPRGSTAPAARIVATRYVRHNGRPLAVAAQLLGELRATGGLAPCAASPARDEVGANEGDCPPEIVGLAVTGAAGRPLAEALGAKFFNEVVALSAALRQLYPEFRTALEVGGQDAKIIELRGHGEPPCPAAGDGHPDFSNFAMNSECAAGTGSFLDQQAARLRVRIQDEFGAMALKSEHPPRVAGRCSVFAKTDMIHLQQQAVPDYDIVAGLCCGMARNIKALLARGRELQRPIAFVGGVASNAGMLRAFRQVLEISEQDFRVPPHHDVLAAIGAALCLAKSGAGATAATCAAVHCHGEFLAARQNPSVAMPQIDETSLARLVAHRDAPAARLPPLKEPTGYLEAAVADAPPGATVGVYLGVDVGSISTNLALVDEDGRLLAKIYLWTAGRPIEAVRTGLRTLAAEWAGRARVLGAATTGSGRYLTGDILGADVVRNEITAQARGATHVCPHVDTIFEIGGQDSKYIRLRDGVVVDFEMNHVCAAGTGSFLEEQAERLGISIKDQFARLALSSRAPLRLGERCTVFMESDLVHHQQQGAALEDLVAGLCYSIAANYLNRVVGTRRIGEHVLFQGGTAFNRAVTAALEALTGRPITVPPHHEMTGAIGAALLARDAAEASGQARDARRAGRFSASAFRGFNLADRPYQVETFTCNSCSNYCDIRRVRLEGEDPLYYGSRCDKYNKKKAASAARADWPDLFAERERLLLGLPAKEARRAEENLAGGVSPRSDARSTFLSPPPQRGGGATGWGRSASSLGTPTRKSPEAIAPRGVVGIPRALVFHQLLPFWRTLLEKLGYEVRLSPPTDAEIIKRGVESVLSQTCFPVKIAHGHVRWLVEHGVDCVLLPSLLSLPRDHRSQEHNRLCPYVQSIAYQVESALGLAAAGVKLMSPEVDMEEGYESSLASLWPWARELRHTRGELAAAVRAAARAQNRFEEACRARGREILAAPPPGAALAVLVSRPYNGCDPGVNLDLARRMSDLDLLPVPMDFMDLGGFDLAGDWANMYWKYGQRILRAAEIIRSRPDLQAVYVSNFGCGPDSFLRRFFQEALGRKPFLSLEIDEHSAPAGLVTRLEAFLDSLRGAASRAAAPAAGQARVFPPARGNNGRTLLIPHMCDHAYAFAAAFRGAGLQAQVIPPTDDESLALGRRWTDGRECLPCITTAGDMLRELGRPGADPAQLAFFMPAGSGPCRFGVYNLLHRLILRDAGYGAVPIFSPNQGTKFYEDFRQRLERDPTRAAWQGIVAVDALVAALHALRPYEAAPGAAQAAYRDCLGALESALQRRQSVAEIMHWCARRLGAVALDGQARRPRVGIVGEIYVRSHEFSNQDLVRRLEALGLEVELAAFAEWIFYTNWTRRRRTRQRRQWRLWLGTQIKDAVQRRDEAQVKRPLAALLRHERESDTADILRLAQPYLRDSFEGEAVLSVGKAVELAHEGAAGIVNVMPFTCMPGNVVAAVLRRLQRDLGDLPMLSIAYDGQRDSTLDIRLEAFAEQVKSFAARA